jgi:hypothetical protein
MSITYYASVVTVEEYEQALAEAAELQHLETLNQEGSDD